MRSKVYITVRPSVCSIVRQLQRRAVGLRRAAGLLLSAQLAGHIYRQRQSSAPSSNGAAAWRSAANAGSVMLTAELTRLNT